MAYSKFPESQEDHRFFRKPKKTAAGGYNQYVLHAELQLTSLPSMATQDYITNNDQKSRTIELALGFSYSLSKILLQNSRIMFSYNKGFHRVTH